MSMKKKVVVVGGAGFIGSNLSHALVDKGFDVYVVDCFKSGKRERVPISATIYEINICNFGDLEKTFKSIGKIYCVFHLAALPRVQYSIDNPTETHEVNVTGTLNVLSVASGVKVRRLVYSASSSAYGNQSILPLEEGMSANPNSPYGLQKYIGELYVKLWSQVYALPTISLRYFNVYGPGLDPEGPYALVIGKFLKQRKEEKPLTITGDGKQTRDFTHVSDVVRANILAMESAKVGKGEVINIGAGKDVSIKELALMFGGKVKYIKPRIETKHSLADNRIAKKLLGWRPDVKLEDGISELKKIFGVQ